MGTMGPRVHVGPRCPAPHASAPLLQKRASQALQLGWSDTEFGTLFSVKVLLAGRCGSG